MAKAQILVVEDDNIVVLELRDRLQSLGYAVLAVASHGEEAIEKAAETRPDLVLMDIRLKGDVDGVGAAEQIRARFDIPVVYLTAYADEDTLQRAKVTEPYGYIIKPFEERELHGTIEIALYKHKMERKLKKSERWLATTLRSIGDAVIATDNRGSVTFMNPVAESLTGWRLEDALGEDLTEVFNIVNEETRTLAESPITKAIREGVVVDLADHSILIAKDGREIPIDDSAAPIRDDKENITGVVVVFRDITARKRAEEELDRIFNLSPDMICISGFDGYARRLNPAFEKTLGYTNEEILARPFLDFVHPEDRAATIAELQKLATGTPTVYFEQRCRCKDGSYKWLAWANAPVVEEGLMYAVAHDITERKRAEEEIKRRAAQAALAYEVGQRVSAKLEPDELLAEIVTAVCDAFDYYGVMILLLDDEAKCLTMRSIAGGYAEVFPEGLWLAIGEGMIGYAAASGETQISGDVSKDPHYVRKAEEETKSELAIPIRSGEKVIGVLDLQSDEFDAFNETDIMLMETLTGQIAVAIENARLYEETQRRALEQETLREAALALTTALDRNEVIDRILAQLQQVVPYDSASVQLLQGDRLVIIGGHGFPNLPDLLGSSFPADGDNPNSEVIRTRAPFIVKDAPTVYEGFRKGPHMQTVIRSWLGVPMLIGEQLVGMIALDKREPGFYTQGHARLAETFAAQGAITIENARLFEEIEERRVYLEGVLGAAPDAIVTLDDRFQVVEWNAGAERLFGYSREEAVGQHLDHLVTNPDVFEEAIGFTQRVLGGKELPPTEAVRYRKDGSPVDVIVAGSPILVGDELIGVVAVYTDITHRKRMEETLRALALLDELTNLYNRRGFFTLGQQQLKAADRTKTRMLLLFTDLDGMKQINDTFGHQEGDRALIEAAEALEETFRESDIIARIGWDEFVVLAIETNRSPAEVLIHRLQENLEARNAREGRRYELSLSVGLARYDPEHPCSIDELVAQADRAMYEQKRG